MCSSSYKKFTSEKVFQKDEAIIDINGRSDFILENNNEELKKVFVDYKDNKLIVSKGLDNQQAA